MACAGAVVVSVACAAGAAVSGACAGVEAGVVSRAAEGAPAVAPGGVSRPAAEGGVGGDGRSTGFGVVTRFGVAPVDGAGAGADAVALRGGVESPRRAGAMLSATARAVSGSTAAVSLDAGAAGAVSVAGASPVRRSPHPRNIETPTMFSKTKHGRPPRMGSFLSGLKGPGGPTAENERSRGKQDCYVTHITTGRVMTLETRGIIIRP